MLTHLTINNFMLIDHLDLDLKGGMTAITGETGTGKSVLLGALTLALGERADGDRVRHGASKADITATFLLDDLPKAREWLLENDLLHADECLLRRVVTAEGRSRAFINSQPATLHQVKALGELLIDIHSQHAHQSLLVKANHKQLIDSYSQHLDQVNEVGKRYRQWQQLKTQYNQLRENAEELNARYQLLRYQVDELNQLGLDEGELTRLEAEQQNLANAESIICKTQEAAELCSDEQGISALLQKAISVIQSVRPHTPVLSTIDELLNSALIHVDEARHSLRNQLDAIEIDPERLQEVETRLSTIYDIARKHHIQPQELTGKHQQLAQELASLEGGDQSLSALEEKVQLSRESYFIQAQQLSQQRLASAEKLSNIINEQLKSLAMASANVLISVLPKPDNADHSGIDDIEILISTNPGQAHLSLAKVVSGGELSRVSLAIQVATAQTSGVATLVFDEVDVGIGGSTADVVGTLLARLGQQSQVLCVTHLAQVASKANNHWQVNKQADKDCIQTTIVELDEEMKVQEIARMISGSELSEESLAHARLMTGL